MVRPTYGEKADDGRAPQQSQSLYLGDGMEPASPFIASFIGWASSLLSFSQAATGQPSPPSSPSPPPPPRRQDTITFRSLRRGQPNWTGDAPPDALPAPVPQLLASSNTTPCPDQHERPNLTYWENRKKGQVFRSIPFNGEVEEIVAPFTGRRNYPETERTLL